MIYETLQILKEQLENYLFEAGLEKTVVLENIALWESGSEEADKVADKVVISLIKIDEEPVLKNTPPYRVKDNQIEYQNPPVHINLYVLISGNRNSYEKSLRSISKTVEFFQGKSLFTSSNTVYNRTNVAFEILDYFKFNVQLYTPGFEQLNNIWGTLGGRQLPSVIYKVQIVQIKQDKKLSTSSVITHVGGDLNHIE